MSIERWKCRVCGKIGLGRIPKGGDGTEILPTRHKHQGKLCPGYIEAAIPVDDDEPATFKSLEELIAEDLNIDPPPDPEHAGEDFVAEWHRRFARLYLSDNEPEPES